MMKRSQQVLPCLQIDAGLAPYGRIELRQDCRGDLHDVYAAHVERCQQAGDVSDHTPTEGDEDRVPSGAQAG